MRVMYSADNYARLGAGPRQSAEQIVPLIMDLFRPTSVVDLGCGQGSWLAEFSELGVKRITGVDGDWAIPSLQIPAEHFVAADVSQPVNLPEKYDMALCLECAHYLPNGAGEILVNSLVNLAPVVLLSAGVPFQSGTTGTNDQWPEYWKDLFERKGYVLIDCIRQTFWENEQVTYYYRQNSFIFAQRDYVDLRPRLLEFLNAPQMSLRVIHPLHYMQMIEYLQNPEQMATPRLHVSFTGFPDVDPVRHPKENLEATISRPRKSF